MLRTLLPTAALAALAVAAPAQAATPVSTTFTTVGESTFDVPAGVHHLDVALTGAHGGSGGGWAPGGRGAKVDGLLDVTPGQRLYVEVGDAGHDFLWGSSSSSNPGGANGGGAGSTGGGGASDIRTSPASAADSLLTRLAVAGGGGGTGFLMSGSAAGGDAGAAGSDPSGGDAGGKAGTQSAGGAGGTASGNGASGTPGTLGAGGVGAAPNFRGGGGGGGLYGGGGGAGMGPCNPCNLNGGGGGGSSLVPAGGTLGLAPQTDPAKVTISYDPPRIAAAARVEFPSTHPGDVSAGRRIKLTNPSRTTDVDLNGMTLDSDDYIIGGSTCAKTLAPGADCSVSVRFAPSGTGTRKATLHVESSATPLAIELSGTGALPTPAATPAPATPAPAAAPAAAPAQAAPALTIAPAAKKPAAKTKVASVTCFAKRCRVTGAPNGRAKLVRKGRVYAAGKLPGKLKTRRVVLPGRYTLKVGHKNYRAVVR